VGRVTVNSKEEWTRSGSGVGVEWNGQSVE